MRAMWVKTSAIVLMSRTERTDTVRASGAADVQFSEALDAEVIFNRGFADRGIHRSTQQKRECQSI